MGWKRLAKYLSNFLQRKKQMSMQIGIHSGKVNHANQIRNQVQRIQMTGKEEATDKNIHCDDKMWNEALIITKGQRNIRWDLVREVSVRQLRGGLTYIIFNQIRQCGGQTVKKKLRII